jgi:outer membrane lipopolysaccharide assembly protein LptE/RlpB
MMMVVTATVVVVRDTIVVVRDTTVGRRLRYAPQPNHTLGMIRETNLLWHK